MIRRFIIGTAMCLMIAAPALAAGIDGDKPMGAAPAAIVETGQVVADNRSCPNACQAAHDRCRIQRKGSPSCDAERQACLVSCLKKKK